MAVSADRATIEDQAFAATWAASADNPWSWIGAQEACGGFAQNLAYARTWSGVQSLVESIEPLDTSTCGCPAAEHCGVHAVGCSVTCTAPRVGLCVCADVAAPCGGDSPNQTFANSCKCVNASGGSRISE
jgi:hypothetical protein